MEMVESTCKESRIAALSSRLADEVLGHTRHVES